MSDKAQVSNKFKDFKANLTTRPWIVWGMGSGVLRNCLTGTIR